MNYTRLLEIENEAKKRLNEWLTNSSFEEMTHKGSRLVFDMSLGLMGGYPFKAKKWMQDNFGSFITQDEFYNPEYDFIINELFEKTFNENPINWDEE